MLLLLFALLCLQPPADVHSGPLGGHKEASPEDWLTRALHYMETNPETLEELMSRDHEVLEGDMVLSSDRNAVESRWPTQEIPYIIGPDLAGQTSDILSAMDMVSQHTCVSFHLRTSETNYLLFVRSRGCASYVGFIGGEQPVYVGHLCAVGNIVHEILHALGFHHEHTRADREDHITILHHNIMDGMERNFQKQEGKTFDIRYDVASIMHYGSGFFSANGLPTIIANSDEEDMGQRDKLTETDIKRVRLLYGCDPVNNQTQGSTGVKVEELNDVASPLETKISGSTNRTEDQTSLPLPVSLLTSLQYLNSSSRGHHDTRGGLDL